MAIQKSIDVTSLNAQKGQGKKFGPDHPFDILLKEVRYLDV